MEEDNFIEKQMEFLSGPVPLGPKRNYRPDITYGQLLSRHLCWTKIDILS
jgi:hypothetical protein